MIGKHVVIDTLDNFKTKLDLIPSSAIVLIKDVGQIYAHGTYFGAQKTYSLLTKTADGLAPKGGTSASSLIKDGETEWVLTVTNGENPSWRRLPDNAFNSLQYTLPAATTTELGGIKVGKLYTATFSDLVGKYYKINIDKDGLAYVEVPWTDNDYRVEQVNTSVLDEDFRVTFSGTATNDTKTETLRKSSKLLFNPVSGKLTSTTFEGNLDGNYINKLTGYAIAKQEAAISVNDSLNLALGKLEYKLDSAYNWYKGISETDDDSVINKWTEIVDFVDSITEGTDIITKFVTTDTDLNITGIKTFTSKISILSISDSKIILNNTEEEESKILGISFLQNGVEYGRLQTFGSNDICWNKNKIWHEGNDGSGSGLDADFLDGYHASSFPIKGTHFVNSSAKTCTYDTWTRVLKVADVSGWGIRVLVNVQTHHPSTIMCTSFLCTFTYDKKITINELSGNNLSEISIRVGSDSVYGLETYIDIRPKSKYSNGHTYYVSAINLGYTGSPITHLNTTNVSALAYSAERTSTAGGAISSAKFIGNLVGNADTATALSSSAGSSTNPIYFSGGKPEACTYSLNATVPSNAIFTDTTYSAGTGISISGTTISNSGVRSISAGSTDGTISVNTGGTSADVSVTGLGSLAFKSSISKLTSTTETSYNGGLWVKVINAQLDLVGNTSNAGAWSIPSGSPDAYYGNGTILRLGWTYGLYYTEIYTGPNILDKKYGLYWRQVVNGSVKAWKILMDTDNYNYYVPKLDGTGATGTWGISISGSSGSCTGNAATATNVAWSGITSRPTTLSGYGITDNIPGIVFRSTANFIPTADDLNSYTADSKAGLWNSYDNKTYTNGPRQNFGLLVMRINTSYSGQLCLPYNNGSLRYRSLYYTETGGAWRDWKTILDSDNYTEYALSKTGTAAAASKLATSVNINGTSFNGTSDITTSKWGTSRSITIGSTAKSVDGSGNVSWSSNEIGYLYKWGNNVKVNTWSRLCFVNYASGVIGCKFLINVSGTRNSVVFNDLYAITAHHSNSGNIIKLCGSHYSSGYKLRILSNTTGSCYVEMYDNLVNVDSVTYQYVHCRLIPIFTGDITIYESYTAGSIPSGYSEISLTLNSYQIQGSINASATDGYSISVGTAGTDSSTIYFVT